MRTCRTEFPGLAPRTGQTMDRAPARVTATVGLAATTAGAAGAGRDAAGGRQRLLRQWGKPLRYRRHDFGRQASLAGQTVPADIGEDAQQHADQHDRTGRQPAIGHRHREGQVGLAFDLRRLGLEAPHHLLGVEPQNARVAADIADGVGIPGQRADAPVLQRVQMRQAMRRQAATSGRAQPRRSRAARRSAPERSGLGTIAGRK